MAIESFAWLLVAVSVALHGPGHGNEPGMSNSDTNPGNLRTTGRRPGGVAFHFKQWGNWRPRGDAMERMSKKATGRELDGRTWDDYPVLLHG